MVQYGPVEGSPLIPPDILTIYFASFLFLLVIFYVFLRFKGRDVRIKNRLQTVFYLAIVIKFAVLIGGGLLTTYWLVPKPFVSQTKPVTNDANFATNQKIEIVFDRPISRTLLEKTISPETPGVWVFESSIYRTHFFRRVVFYPTTSLKPNTEYKITLSNIKNTIRTTDPYTYEFTFKTQQSPKVADVVPSNGTKDVKIDSVITVALTHPNDMVSEIQFEINPAVPFETTLDRGKKIYTLAFKEPLKQGKRYDVTVRKTDLTWNLEDKEITAREATVEEYKGSFTTKEAPGIAEFAPSEENVLQKAPIEIQFSQEMNRKSIEDNFTIEPMVFGTYVWKDDKTFTFTPKKLSHETTYKVKIAKGAKAKDGGFFEEDVEKTFTTIGSVKVTNINPADGWKGVGIASPIKIIFDQEVNKESAQSKFSLSPNIPGSFSWIGNTMTFIPENNFSYSTSYVVTVAAGVKSIKGLDSKTEIKSSFTTQDKTFKLAVPAYLQQHALSCEIAALRMALAHRGHSVSEETLLGQVGLDPTPHSGNTWGNPHNAFVGNVDGKQMVNGYGVYWEPIAKTAQLYRNAQAFEGWSINQLTEAIGAGNPVIIWVYSSGGWPTEWFTPDGRRIYAVRDEHAVTAVGFVGSADNPSQMIINDPLYGQVYWSRTVFDRKWNIFNRSGVVVF